MPILGLLVIECGGNGNEGGLTIGLEPVSQTVALQDGSFTVRVEVTGAREGAQPAAFEYQMFFDPAVLRVQTVELGPYVASTGRDPGCVDIADSVDNEEGKVAMACYSLGETTEEQESGTLSIVTFTPLAEGSTALELEDVELAAELGEGLDFTVLDGQVTVESE